MCIKQSKHHNISLNFINIKLIPILFNGKEIKADDAIERAYGLISRKDDI